MGPWRDAETFSALDAARRAHRVPLIYQAVHRKHVTEITVDGFFVPDDVTGRLAGLYADYVKWWVSPTTPERRWFPRHGLGLSNFEDFVHLTVLREHANWWIKLLDDAAPLTYNRWERALNAWRTAS